MTFTERDGKSTTDARKRREAIKATQSRKLRAALESRGWTQADLAEATNIPPYAISRAVRGENVMSRDLLERIADVLELDVDFYLQGRVEPDDEPEERLQTLYLSNGKVRVQLVAEVMPGVPALIEHLIRHEKSVSAEDTMRILGILTGMTFEKLQA